MQILNGSIDLNKIDKSKIKEVKLKTGATAKFLDVTIIINDDVDKYNNIASISIGQTKEEREAKHSKTFLGNLKMSWNSSGTKVVKESKQDDNLPF